MKKILKNFLVLIVMLLMILTINTKVYAVGNTNDVDTQIWGYESVFDGHTTYVKEETGSIQWSVPVTKDICWVKSVYLNYGTWYGLDNSKGTYEDGSMFWVRMIFSDSFDYNYYEQRLDEDYFTNESDSNWIIIFGVTKPDGTITELDSDKDFLKDTNLYIQLGDIWDREKVNNYLEEINQKHIEYVNIDKEGIRGVFAKVGDSSSYVGTVFGEGNVYIICGITVILMASCLGIIIYVKKRRLKVNSSED